MWTRLRPGRLIQRMDGSCLRAFIWDGYIDRTIRLLVRDQDILKVEEIVSDEIVY